ncbi:hypothetical protein SD70_12020 [Gordoniibacillus kamchatkensis]|uniref:Uncharacterized protein n=1 Tax=Gordoniibacillus kamchatkensis TaxID=1590651 RepID=A0ABR5AHZ6_9BACL|nr:hypothetical protein [Paenibacillus sp. VKM B-2647]KIL40639.1 hypothetical protein SD70_12020 [Paenibacillus sp. VKM B-2647]
MTRRGKLAYALVLGTILTISGYSLVKADSANTTQGTVNDPLVTKSYVDSLLKGAGQATQPQQPTTPSTPAPTPSTATGITVVQLKNGQTLYAAAGSELLVRTGKTVAVSIDENGIPDATAGKDLAPGAAVENNHLLIFPREGRGVKAAPKNTQDIYIMVRGSYSVVNEDGSKADQ